MSTVEGLDGFKFLEDGAFRILKNILGIEWVETPVVSLGGAVVAQKFVALLVAGSNPAREIIIIRIPHIVIIITFS